MEAQTGMAERGRGWRDMSHAALRSLGNKATKPLASEVSAWGWLSLHTDGSWMCGGSLQFLWPPHESFL